VRLPWLAVGGGTLVVAVGAAGLIAAAVPQSLGSGTGTGSAAAEPIAVTNAYVRAPVPPTKVAAAYFTVYNTTSQPDKIVSVETGAGAVAVLHTVQPDGTMVADPNGVVIPAHGTLVLSTGKGHVMIEQLFGPLKAGQSVDIEVDFQNAGPVNVVAPVLGPGTPAPGGGK
jgi:copper(I)-binding protein